MPKQITKVKWSAMDIPFGVEFDEKTGTFSGTPEDVGEYVIPVSVTTNYGKDMKDVVMKVVDDIITEVKGNIEVLECVDDGNEIIFFGNTPDENIGVFFTYNPATKVTSNILRLMDGNPLKSTNTGIENSPFKEVAIDPVSKKWIAFFGTHYVRTPEGVKDLGSEINLGSMTLCWANKLQRFCLIADNQDTSNIELTSYVFDIDGNLVDSSTQIRTIYGFNIKPNSCGGTVAWSDVAEKFVAVSVKNVTYESDTYRPAIYSSDGLTWDYVKIKETTGQAPMETSGVSGATKTVTFPNITNKLITLTNGKFLLVSTRAFTDYTDNGSGYYTGYHSSSDGITWTKNNNIEESLIYDIICSDTKNKLYEIVFYDSKTYKVYNNTNSSSYSIGWRQSLANSNSVSTANFGVSFINKNDQILPDAKEIRMIWSDTANALVIPELLNGYQLFKITT